MSGEDVDSETRDIEQARFYRSTLCTGTRITPAIEP